VCIDNSSYHLTLGGVYDAEPISDEKYEHLFNWWIHNDRGYRHMVEGNLFKPLSYFRDKKLKKLLDE
jgi:hypothetical protein